MRTLHWQPDHPDLWPELDSGHVWVTDGDRTIDWGQHVTREDAVAHAAMHDLRFAPEPVPEMWTRLRFRP